MTPWAEATLFASARAEHVARVIRPALDRGAWVVCDRYIDSSLVYQGIARGLGVEQVLELNLGVTGGLLPAQTFVLALDIEAARSRQGDVPRPDRARGRGVPPGGRGRLPGARDPLPEARYIARRVAAAGRDRGGGT